jgi:hypothetical protein
MKKREDLTVLIDFKLPKVSLKMHVDKNEGSSGNKDPGRNKQSNIGIFSNIK